MFSWVKSVQIHAKPITRSVRAFVTRPVDAFLLPGLVVMFCVLAWLFYFFYHWFAHDALLANQVAIKPKSTGPAQGAAIGSQVQELPPQYNLEQARLALSQKQKITFPEVVEQTLVDYTQLDDALKSLLLPGAEKIEAYALQYRKGLKGGKFTYKLPTDGDYDWMRKNIASRMPGNKLVGLWNELYGFIEYSSPTLDIRVVWQKTGEALYTVEVQSAAP